MSKPVVVCAADIGHLPETQAVLEDAFDVRYVEPTEPSLAQELPDAEAYFASLHVRLTAELMALAPKLRAAATPSTGLDHIDFDAAEERNIAVLGLKDDRTLLDRITATAELTWTLLLACARRIPEAVEHSRKGIWARDALRGRQIAYKTLGILGCGRLGAIVADYGRAFRMRVIGCDRRNVQLPDVEMVSFERLLRESDILTIHIHLTPENRRLIGPDQFAMMKDGAVLINTSRGAILDEEALVGALESGKLSAAGLDVIEGEWREDLSQHPLIAYERMHPNLIITPHLGGVTYESQEMAYKAAAEKLVAFFHP